MLPLFKNYIDLAKNEYTRSQYILRYSGDLSPLITVEYADKDSCFFIAPTTNHRPLIAFSSVGTDGKSGWSYKMVEYKDVGGEKRVNNGSRRTGKSILQSIISTSDSSFIGASPTYIKIRAKSNESSIGIMHGFMGKTVCLHAGMVPFLARPDSFLMCEKGVVLNRFLLSHINGISDPVLYDRFGYYGFLKISGNGLCFLQGGCHLEIIGLEPGQAYSCHPRYIMGFSESVSIKAIDYISADQPVWDALGMDSAIIMKADERGGILLLSDKPYSGTTEENK